MNSPDPSAGEPLLEFRNVSLRAMSPYDAGLQAVSFSLRAGEVALVRLAYGHTITPLADLAEGLLDPGEGEVVYQGVPWTRRDAAISAELTRLGRSGVPVYALYSPGSAGPRLLSEILSVDEVQSALAALPSS